MKGESIMKSKLIFFTAVLLTQTATAQDTLLTYNEENGGFGGSATYISSVNGDTAVISGTRAAWLFGHTRMLGIAWYNLTSPVDAPTTARDKFGDPNMEMEFRYGGVEVGYTLHPERLIHGGVSCLLGAGGVNFTKVAGNNNADDMDVVFVVVPAISGELNVFSWFRISADIKYRLVTSAGLTGTDNGDLSALGAGVTLKFGSF